MLYIVTHKRFSAWFNVCIYGPVLRQPTAKPELLVQNIYTDRLLLVKLNKINNGQQGPHL